MVRPSTHSQQFPVALIVLSYLKKTFTWYIVRNLHLHAHVHIIYDHRGAPRQHLQNNRESHRTRNSRIEEQDIRHVLTESWFCYSSWCRDLSIYMYVNWNSF